jgi:hypothetical protein
LYKKIIGVLAILVAAYIGLVQLPGVPPAERLEGSLQETNEDQISRAFREQATDRWVSGEGEIIKLLPDDNDGSRHQRLIIRLDSGQTLLIAHNIDLAPKVDHLETGDRVGFEGVYEWNKRGGVVHWTHHDPQGRERGGWLEYQGKQYR